MRNIVNIAVSVGIVLALASLVAAQGPRPTTAPPVSAVLDTDRPQIDVEKYTIELTIVPEDHRVNAVVDIRFRQLERNTFVAFDIHRDMAVKGVTSGGEAVRHKQFPLDNTVEVDVSGLPIGETQTLRFELFGILQADEGRQREPILSRVSADSAFLLYDGKWFPTNGLYRDKADMQLHVSAPGGWNVVSDLSPTMSQTGNAAFTSREPGFWGMVAAGRYGSTTFKSDGQEIGLNLLKADSKAAEAIAETSASVLGFYSQTFGSLASPQFRIVEVQGANWSSRWSAGTLVMPSSQFRADFDKPELAIALARQWFPLKVAVRDPSRDAWLQDGMAVFASLLYSEKTLSPSEAQDQIDRALVRALSFEGSTSTRQAGALDKESPEYRALVEYKGAYIFRMLRWVMEDQKFNTFLSRYMDRFQKTPASTETVTQLASEVAGEDLTYFFDQWVNATGVPEMEEEWVISRIRTGYKITGTIKQDLDLFRMPVELEFITDGDPEYRRVEVSGPSTNFDVNTDRQPEKILIDPRKKILRMSEDLRVLVFISRGEEAANSGNYADALNDFQNAIDLDPKNSLALFRMGESLFDTNNFQGAIDSFRQALAGNLQPKWVEVWSHINMGKVYDLRGGRDRDRAVGEYQQALNTGDDSYGAQAEAQKYLAAPFRKAP